LKPLLKHAAAKGDERLEQLFRNSFNENYKKNANEEFYKKLINFIMALQRYYDGIGEDQFELLYGALRFIHFIHNKQAQAHEQVV
ncbi:MAG: hypothetical protein ACRESZ_20180, partial [Methylococcales bacterium]